MPEHPLPSAGVPSQLVRYAACCPCWKAARASRLARLKEIAFDLAMRGNVQLIKFLITRYGGAPEKEPPQPIVAQSAIVRAASPLQEIDGVPHDPPAKSLSAHTTARG